MAQRDDLATKLDRLASFQPTGAPVISLYLNTQANQHGRDSFGTFLRREFKDRRRSYPPHSEERASLDRDMTRIEEYLQAKLEPATNAVAIFASSGSGGFFEAVQLAALIDENWLFLADQPQLYPLARIHSQYPRYAVVLADTAAARILVFSTGAHVDTHEMKGEKTRGRSIGGWSQSRYQRRVDNAHAAFVREMVQVLERVVRAEAIEAVILAGDDAVLPLIRAELPKALAALVLEDVHLRAVAAAHEVAEAASRVLARHNEMSDRQKVEAVMAAHRGRGLGVVGVEDTLNALHKGQVDELLIAASLATIKPTAGATSSSADIKAAAGVVTDGAVASPETGTAVDATIERGGANLTDARAASVGDELVTLARQTGARVTFIEAAELLDGVGGVAASLRFRIEGAA